MSVLFVIGSLSGSTAFRAASEMAKRGMKIFFLFTRGGCLHATDPEIMEHLSYAEGVYCLESDCESQGLSAKITGGVELMDYNGWVKLIEKCRKVVSWN